MQEKPLRQPKRDLGTWPTSDLLEGSKQGPPPCFIRQKNAPCGYHNYAAFLRRLADQTQAETARARLRNLADQFDQLGASVHQAKLVA